MANIKIKLGKIIKALSGIEKYRIKLPVAQYIKVLLAITKSVPPPHLLISLSFAVSLSSHAGRQIKTVGGRKSPPHDFLPPDMERSERAKEKGRKMMSSYL